MKTFFCCLCFMLYGVISVNAQSFNKTYIGVGLGFDYGGLAGLKFEYLPVKYLGLFGGAGYNLLSLGWNTGVSGKILPDKRVCPTVTAFYGYNAVFKGKDNYAKRYEMTSYGVTFGGGVDIKVGRKGHKISTSLFLPIRSQEFRDNYQQAQDDPYLNIDNALPPIAVSAGFNFAF